MRVRNQLQHWAVFFVCTVAGVPATVRGDADEHGEYGAEPDDVLSAFAGSKSDDADAWVQLLDADDAEQLRGEPELPAGAGAGLQPGHPADTAAGDRLNIGYTGAHGGDLDIVRAPNRNASGVLNPRCACSTMRTRWVISNLNALAINARKRMQKGISLQATYTYAHSIDDASSVGGSGQQIAQNDQDLGAEKSNSSFDLRQKVTRQLCHRAAVRTESRVPQ